MNYNSINIKIIILKFISNYKRREQLLYERGIFSYIFNQSGYVMIMVLIITTLLISISGKFSVVSHTNIKYMQKFKNRVKAGFLAKSGVQLAQFILKADKKGMLSENMLTGKSINKNVDSFNDLWAINFPELPIGDGTLTIRISDENSKINISAISNEFVDKTPYYQMLQRFFLNMELSMDHADTILDWVDTDDASSSYGAESSDYYQTLLHPYRAKNGAMDSIDEMLMIKGITPKIFYGLGEDDAIADENMVDHNKGDTNIDMKKIMELAKNSTKEELEETYAEEKEKKIGKEKSRMLSKYLRVNGHRGDYLNAANKININTATYRVLSALTDNMTDDIVTELITRRLSKPFKNISETTDLIQNSVVEKNILSVKSSIFKITVTAEVDNTVIQITTIYNRDSRKYLYWNED